MMEFLLELFYASSISDWRASAYVPARKIRLQIEELRRLLQEA